MWHKGITLSKFFIFGVTIIVWYFHFIIIIKYNGCRKTKKRIHSKIEAEAATKNVRSKIKSYIHEKQNVREGFKESFEPLIESQVNVKESVDKEQNALIEQLQKNQLALTEGIDKNRLAITQGFDKMDDVKKWDLLQLPGYEAIEEPEMIQDTTLQRKEDDDGDDDDDDDETDLFPPIKMKYKDYIKIFGDYLANKDPEEIVEAPHLKYISSKLRGFNYKYDKDKNMLTLVGEKPEEIAKFNFKDLDKGLEYKDAKDYLDSFKFHYPSVMAEKSISKINRKLEKAQEGLGRVKMDLRNRAVIQKIGGLD